MTTTIFDKRPVDWKELQTLVGKILSDVGFECEVEKDIETVRGHVNVDVFAQNIITQPHHVIISECKYWTSNVPKTIVHSFRTVVNDFGANSGYIISRAGFQSGAFDAVKNSNISLMTWQEFQDFFKPVWLNSMLHKNHIIGKPLMDFTDYMGSFYDKEFELLPDNKKNEFVNTVKKYSGFAWLSNKQYYTNHVTGEIEYLDQAINEHRKKLPIDINCYSDYLYFIQNYCIKGLEEIDLVFGKSVRKGQ